VAFFRNSTVNLLNLHYGIHQIAQSGGAAFVASYLLKAGIPIPVVFISIALIMVVRFVIRPALIGIAAWCGLRALVIAGTVICAFEYPFLPEIHGIGWALYGFVAISAIGETIYWPSYHAYFAALGDSEHRGHQLGIREAIAAMVGIVSPLVSGWLLVTIGPKAAFYAATLFAVLSITPLMFTPDVKVQRHVKGAFKAAKTGILIFISDGFVASSWSFIWPIALFTSLGQNFLAFGGALAIAALVGAVASILLGRHIDMGHGGRAVWFTFGSLTGVTLLRAIAIGSAPLSVLGNALGALVNSLYMPTVMTAVYNEAKRSPCTLRFHVATDGGWDIGGASGLLIAALLTALGAPLSISILLSFVGVASNFLILRHYYGPKGAGAHLVPLAET
jgi:hypothetical protein